MKAIIIEALMPVVSTILSILVPAALAWLYARIQKWTGLEIEAKHREALQSALANAGRLIATGLGQAAATEYVRKSVPDAIKALGVAERIEELLAPHLPPARTS